MLPKILEKPLQKLFVILFLIFAFSAYGMAFSFSQWQDRDKVVLWCHQPDFQVYQLLLAPDLGGEAPLTVAETLTNLSETHGINVFLRAAEQFNANTIGAEFFVHLQYDEYLDRLPTSTPLWTRASDFNQAVGQIITNKEAANKAGHLIITSKATTFSITPLQSFDRFHDIGNIYISGKNGPQLDRFVAGLQEAFPELQLNYMDYEGHGLLYNIRSLLQSLRTPILVSGAFLFLTAAVYMFNQQRAILIEKLHGLSNGRILFTRLWQVLWPSWSISLALTLPFHAIYNGYFNSRLLTVFMVYLSALLLISALVAICSTAALAYIMHLRPADLLKHMKPDFILLSSTFFIKVITIPLLILSLSASAYNLSTSLEQRSQISAYKELYKNYVYVVGDNIPGKDVGIGPGGSYINRVYASLNSEHDVVFFSDRSQWFEVISVDTLYGYTNSEYVNRLKLVDTENNVVSLKADRDYVLVPERHYALFKSELYAYKEAMYHVAPIIGDIHSLSDDEIEAEVFGNFIIIKDNQSIPTLDISMLNKAFVDNYILIIRQDNLYLPENGISIWLDIEGLSNYEDAFNRTLAELGPALVGFAPVSSLLEQVLSENQAMLSMYLRETMIYLLLLIFISYLTLYFFYHTRLQQTAVRALHGHSIFDQFWQMTVFILILDNIAFLYLVFRGSYMGQLMHLPPKWVYSAFIFLLGLDVGILMLSVNGFKRKSIHNIVKRID
ncbi:MAG: hypothetical protein ACOX2G_05135 [Bacillota bacterium]